MGANLGIMGGMSAEVGERVANPPTGMPRVLAHLVYDEPGAAVDWLTRVFGFRERVFVRHTDASGRMTRTQLDVVDSVITVGEPSVHGGSPAHGVSSMLYVYVDDVEAHYRQARESGAKIVMELADRPWGDRTYQASDPEGHQWMFAEHVADVVELEEHLHT
jgi:uncharacterized glyoxalase superfamily protein PhnB